MSLAGCQINPIEVNFHFQKSLEICDKNSADKIWPQKGKKWKVSPLMSITVKLYDWEIMLWSLQLLNIKWGKALV